MKLDRHDVGIGGVVGGHVIVFVRDVRGNTWTKAFPRGPTVTEEGYAEWLRGHSASSGWHYAPGQGEIKEVSTVYEANGAVMFVSGMGAVTAANIAQHKIDDVVSLGPLSESALREIVVAQRKGPVRHHACPVRDQIPAHWGDADRANARRAAEVTLAALRNGRRVMVHCLMGVHRSPALATAVVAILDGIPLEEASRSVRARRALAMWVPETAQGFLSALGGQTARAG